jgi:predicted acetyltransferase
MTLHLRPLDVDDEVAATAAHVAMQPDDFTFLLWREHAAEWHDYVHLLSEQRRGLSLSVAMVPAAFLVADVDGEIVGRVSVRSRLNRFLMDFGGHIGYGVLPQFRRRGYASEILRQALIIARSEGLTSILITCDDDNVASRGVIEANGGVFEALGPSHDGTHQLRRYWIT